VPVGSTVISATLTLNMSKTISGPSTVALHPALKNWGEGASNAAMGGRAGEGAGIQAQTGDVTWLFTFFNTQSWSAPGGDFGPASASASVNGVGSYQWTGAGVVADVQQWVNNPSMDFGWILTGDESTPGSAKQFDTKENTNPADRPVLTVDFTPPAPDLTIAKSHPGIFHPGETADTYKLTVTNIGAAPTTGTVTVTDTLPAGLMPTAADSGTLNGWSLSFSNQTVTATRSDVLPGGAMYPPLIVTVSVADTVAPLVTNTATVAGGGEVNTSNDTATDPTATAPLADLTVSKRHLGTFRTGATGTYTIIVNNIGGAATNAPVTVTDRLPAGLTYAGPLTVNGWTITATGQTVTATRSDVLATGASYPPLTLTVRIAGSARGSVTNSVVVSGGGEINLTNDTASDVAPVTAGDQIRRRRGA
jgi:uncharacterized repeat protein (TIGR01451 family)